MFDRPERRCRAADGARARRERPKLLRLTDAAAEQIKTVVARADKPVIGLLVGLKNAGCAGMSHSMSTAFADPAKYDLYDCKQLETERKSLANRTAELQGLMAKAETGGAGPVVAELAYRNEYVAVRGQARFAEEAWRRNKCAERRRSRQPIRGLAAPY